MMDELQEIYKDILALGLAALSHVNRIEVQTDKWTELSILQVAHATELLVKAEIAKEHPLLIFDKLPTPTKNGTGEIVDDLTLSELSEKGRTIEWSSLLEMLWASKGVKMINTAKFAKFGRIRNSIQHFGIAPPNENISYLTYLQFIYEVIDPFLYTYENLYAIDYSQDFDPSDENNTPYWNYIRKYLLENEIVFSVSPRLYEFKDKWWCGIVKGNEYSPEEDFDDIIQVSESYYNTMIEQFLAFESAKPLDAP